MPAFFGGPAEKGKVSEMPVFTGTANTVCPFYVRESEFRITCEGISDSCSLSVGFATKGAKRRWQQRYCAAFCYPECPIAAVLLKRN